MTNDLIKRQAAIDTVHRMREIWDTGDIDDLEGMIVTALAELCPAQRIGRWINKPHIYGVAYCSECDFELHINDTPYCPKCGAYMVTEEEM